MAGVCAFAGKPMIILRPGEQYEKLPHVPKDTIMFSGGDRAVKLSERIQKNFGKIDAAKMIEIIKRPVAMKSNLHDAVFLPESLTMYFADAGKKTIACNEKYYKVNLKALLDFYRNNKTVGLKAEEANKKR